MLRDPIHLDSPQHILDIGTGIGAINAANKYPSAEVIGTDLSPIQRSWVPPNCRFEVEDAESPWTSSRESFDLIHSRHLMGAISD
ncbi:uncharacterized protein LAJ45_10054 [Morchella importuna]|uniref:uncharacterized protein n=1 Tax=Morchella importuna TaxID=1174673 RepID=UPI001E8DEB8C|nr:uncharacterized protein LAJ45_10054 [Morchella importuna]KAH8145912.1 hypothetical protein LAJ45_10054 [Morchella importuna]